MFFTRKELQLLYLGNRCVMTIKSLFHVLFLFIAISAYAQDIAIRSAPSWVVPVAIPEESEVSKYDIISGVYYKLIDYQVNFDEDIQFSHFVQNVVTSGGVSNASQLNITYDSSYQKAEFHYLRIKRKEQLIDKTQDVKFEFIKNEEQLQSNIYTGYVTALLVIEDLRKGDLLEFAYSLQGSNPVFANGKFYSLPLEDINPIDRVYARLIFTNVDNEYKCVGCDDAVVKKQENGVTTLLIDKYHIKEVKMEDTMPPWIIPYTYVMLSNTSSWAEVNEWALGIFEQDDDDMIETIFEEIFYPEYTLDDKINAIIDFVQDDIRYMGMESGIGSIMPFSPNQVLKQRFGDCKDKSLLITTMLRKIGLEHSYPVLVNAQMNDNIDQFIPSGYVFDHCIAYFEKEGKPFWLDPTNSYQGGNYATMATYDYGKGLIIRPGTTDLTSMDIKDTTSATYVYEFLDASAFAEPATFKIKTNVEGNKADFTRQVLEYYSKKQLAEFYKYSYGQIFSSLQEAEKLKVNDDILKNEMQLIENYSIPDFWDDNDPDYPEKFTMTFEPAVMYGYVSAINCEKKEHPVFFTYPNKVVQKSAIDLPGPMAIAPESRSFNNAAFTFHQSIAPTSTNSLLFTYEYTAKTDEVSASDFQEVCRDMNDIVNNLGTTIYYPKDVEIIPLKLLKYYYVQLDQKLWKLNNVDFSIEDVVDNRDIKTNSIGQVKTGVLNIPMDAVLSGGINKQFEDYLDFAQVSLPSAAPLTLVINKIKVSEEIGLFKDSAILHYAYSFLLKENGASYVAVIEDSIVSSGIEITNRHEENIRMSLEKSLASLTRADFELAD